MMTAIERVLIGFFACVALVAGGALFFTLDNPVDASAAPAEVQVVEAPAPRTGEVTIEDDATPMAGPAQSAQAQAEQGAAAKADGKRKAEYQAKTTGKAKSSTRQAVETSVSAQDELDKQSTAQNEPDKQSTTQNEPDKQDTAQATEPMDLDAMKARSLNINGSVVPYGYSGKSASAPAKDAGLWLGEDSTTDGSWGYFIGHNPGDFSAVMDLQEGDPVAVCDAQGQARLYHVVLDFVVSANTYWLDIADIVTEYGESIILQTCCSDDAHYRVVVAA